MTEINFKIFPSVEKRNPMTEIRIKGDSLVLFNLL